MADDNSASIIHLHQPKRPRTAAERGRAFRQRQRDKAAKMALEMPVRAAFANANEPAGTFANVRTQRSAVSILLTVSAFGLGAVGVTMNGWFARSLGSTDIAGWLFLAIGVAADCVALVVPSAAATAWQTRQRATAFAGWAIWAVTFAFALTAGIGFASTNITDVTLARASRSTPAVTAAQVALADVMAARDRECKGGVGKFCREREAAVVERRQALDVAMHSIEKTADPQTEAAVRAVAWITFGLVNPSSNDFGILRLILLALLPQVGGVLLMIGRNTNRSVQCRPA